MHETKVLNNALLANDLFPKPSHAWLSFLEHRAVPVIAVEYGFKEVNDEDAIGTCTDRITAVLRAAARRLGNEREDVEREVSISGYRSTTRASQW